jgi:CheY-like chemotaxis protein
VGVPYRYTVAAGSRKIVPTRPGAAQRPAVLVVEDEAVVALDLQKTLSSLGYDAYGLASSAREALACADQRAPDLVLMDIRIQGDVDGVAAAEILRERYDVPVIFLTAYADDVTAERASRVDPYAYLVKPVRAAELHVAVRTAIRRHHLEIERRRRGRWFATALRCVPDGVVTVDPEGRVSSMNDAAERLLDCNATACVGGPLLDVLRLPSATESDRVGAAIADVLSGRAVPQVLEVHVWRPSETRLLTVGVASIANEGWIRGAVLLIREAGPVERQRERAEARTRLAVLEELLTGVAGGEAALEALLDRVRDTVATVDRTDSACAEDADVRAAATRVARMAASLRDPPPAQP